MALRKQLLLFGLLALLLPWAGCSYVSEMESALRTGQLDALQSVTRSVVSALESRSDLVEELAAVEPVPGAEDVYLQSLTVPLVVDGYADDLPAMRNNTVSFAEPFVRSPRGEQPLRLELLAGVAGTQVYIYARVADAALTYRRPASTSLAGATHIELALADSAGQVQRYWISPEGPGEFRGLTRRDGTWVDVFRLRGVWRETADGYAVEMVMPLLWLQQQFGIAAVSAGLGRSADSSAGNGGGVSDSTRSASPMRGDTRRWVGTMTPGDQPGLLLRQSSALARQLQLFGQTNLQLTVVSRQQWLLAQGGRLTLLPADARERVPGAWLLEALYRRAGNTASDATYRGPQQGKLVRTEVSTALTGRTEAIWYLTDTENNLGIVSAAAPVWDGERIVGAVVAEQSSAGIVSLTNSALVRLAGISSALMLVIVGGLLGYASWLSLRIGRLSRQVAKVMEPDGRELQAFPPQTAGDEIGALGRSFALLLGRVRSYTDYLQTLASKLSHELRTPLAVVRSSLDNLAHEPLSPAAREYLARAANSSDRLSHILNAMSEASRVEQSIAGAELQLLDLQELLEQMVAGYRTAYPEQLIRCELPGGPVKIDGNAELLAQMLDKLLDNARDFCRPAGAICFSLRRQEGQVCLSVANDGPSLPAGVAGQLFDSMVSARSESDDQVHMGLGLTIVRLIAEFHGAVVNADNRPDGDGVIVSVRFR